MKNPMDKAKLDALSEAATQGGWSVVYYDCGDTPYYDFNGPCPSIQADNADCAIVHWDGFKQEYFSSAGGDQRQIEANAAFITALVNAYRAGQLVPVPEVEELARVLAGTSGEVRWAQNAPIYLDCATTIIQHMKGNTDG